MRHWAGLADMTPDMAPIMDGNDQVEGIAANVDGSQQAAVGKSIWGFFSQVWRALIVSIASC